MSRKKWSHRLTALCLALGLTMVIGFWSGTVVFGSDSAMTFSGTAVKLSLSEAVERMQTEGVDAKNAQINKQSDTAVANGYSETVATLKDDSGNSATLSTDLYGSQINEAVAKVKRDFAKDNIDKNYQASMNAIEKETVETYYNLLLAQDNVKAAQDNLEIQQELLRTAQTKHAVGKASDNEYKSAQTSVRSGENQVVTAQASLTGARMAANIQFGYDVMQDVTLTDTLTERTDAVASVSDAIANARANRLEIKSAELNYQIQETLLSHLKYRIAQNSSTYLSQVVTVNQAKQSADNKPLELEQEIRTDYLTLQTARDTLETARNKLDQSQRTYELQKLSYEVGSATLSDVQNAQLAVFQAEMAVSSAVKDYNLAVYTYNLAQGVGTSRIAL